MCEQPGAPTRGFEVNGPTVVALLYLATYFTAFPAVVGVVLAYVWRRQAAPAWQHSQLVYLIRTFWLGLAGYAVSGGAAAIGIVSMASVGGGRVPDEAAFALLVLGSGGMLLLTVMLLVRCALVLVNAQQRAPMANPRSWTV